MEQDSTYCTTYAEDVAFGALHKAFSYRLTGSCTANPEYDPEDMRKAVMHTLSSSEDNKTPFLVVLVLPVWEDTPWTSAGIRSHRNLKTLIQIPQTTCDSSQPINKRTAAQPNFPQSNGRSN
jgi:hypothetical protein